MFRALLKLSLLAVLPIVYVSVSESYNPITYVNNRVQEKFMESVFLGTFKEIEAQLMSVGESQRDIKFQEIAGHFRAELKLAKIDEIVQDKRNQSRLRNGELVALANEEESIAYRLADTEWAISVASEETEDQDLYHSARGPSYLFQQAIDKIPTGELAANIPQLEARFGWKLQFIDEDQWRHIKNTKELSNYKELTWFEDDNDEDVIIFQTESGERVSIQLVYNKSLLGLAILLPFMLVFFCICLGLMLWLWPLWRDHKRLTTTAKDFGAGYLDSRVKIRDGAFSSELAKSFNRMADNIQNLVDANYTLTNAIAHDLRTPLARLRFANDFLESESCTEKETERYRKTINTSIDLLDYLVSQALLYSRYNRSADINHFADCNFSTEILEEVDNYQFESDILRYETNIESSLLDSQQFIDSRALKRALSNLLSNAAKHAKSYVLVSFFKKGDRIGFRVEDDGIGINEEDHAVIFQPYRQLTNSERKLSEGVGLGLAIVKQIAHWHNGSISVQKSHLGGACFTLSWLGTGPNMLG